MTRDVVDESEDQLLEEINKTAHEILEPFLAAERELVLGELQDNATERSKK